MALTEPATTYRQFAERPDSQFALETSFRLPTRPQEAASRHTNQMAQMPLATESSSAQPTALKGTVAETQTPPLVQAPGLRSVKAVIGENIGQGNYIVHCYPPTSPMFEIRLPEVLIPRDLRVYGKPVSVVIEVQNGVRRPVITAREITEPLPRLPEQEEVEAWVNSLAC